MKLKIILLTGIIVLFTYGFDRDYYLFSKDKTIIEEITIDQLKSLITKRQGRPLLINIWATWCVPCREEFPGLIKLAGTYNNKMDFVGISVDFPDEIESKIIPFVDKLKVDFPIYVNSEADAEKFINLLNSDWNGAIPATFIYDSNGNQVEFFIGKKSFEELEEVVLNYIN